MIGISVRDGAAVCSCSTTWTGTNLFFACSISYSTYYAICTPDCLHILEMVSPPLPLFVSCVSRIWHIFFPFVLFSRFLCTLQRESEFCIGCLLFVPMSQFVGKQRHYVLTVTLDVNEVFVKIASIYVNWIDFTKANFFCKKSNKLLN